MIPYNILLASILTLYIIIAEFFVISKDLPNKIFLPAIYGITGFLWTMKICSYPLFNIFISMTIGVIAFIMRYSKKINNAIDVTSNTEYAVTKSTNDENTFPFLEKKGKIIYSDGTNQYMGVLEETGDSIVIYSNEKMANNDSFVIKGVSEGKIFAEKIN